MTVAAPIDIAPFREEHTTHAIKAHAEGRVWDVVIIETGLSRNKNFYRENVLVDAIPLFEGCRACAYLYGDDFLGAQKKFNHLPDNARQARSSGYSENVIGFFEGVHLDSFTRPNGTAGRGLLARFNILKGQDKLCEKLLDAWNHGRPDLLGFSIDAGGKARPAVMGGEQVRDVLKIEEVTSTDLVSDAAAGGSFIRLVASFEGGTVDDLLKLLQECRPQWFDGFASPDEGADLSDYALRVLESNLVKAEEIQKEIPVDEVTHLAEVARGVKTLNSVIELLRTNKVKEATALLRNWVASHSMEESGDATSQRRAIYSFPYSAPSGVSPQAGNRSQEPNMTDLATPSVPAPLLEGGAPAAPVTPVDDARAKELEARESKIKEQEEAATKQAGDLRVREAKLLIGEKLSDSKLPEAARDRVRENLLAMAKEGDVTAEQVDEAITKETAYIESINPAPAAPAAPAVPAVPAAPAAPALSVAPVAVAPAAPVAPASDGKPVGLGDAHDPEIKVVQEQYDKVLAGWEGFFNADASAVDGVPAFSSLHEAFGKINGRWYSREDMASLIFESIAKGLPSSPNRRPEEHFQRMRENWNSLPMTSLFREAVTTSDFSVAFGDALFRRLQKTYREDPRNDWRQIVSAIENLTDATNSFNLVRIGAVGSLPVVNQNAPYQEFTDPTEVNEKLTPAKRGALLKFTWEDALADRIGVLRRIPDNLARSAVRTIHELVWDQIDTNPAMASADLLISAANSNVLSGAGALSYANLTTLVQQLRNQTEQDSGKKLGLAPAFLLVGPTKENEAVEITDSNVKVNAGEDATVRSFINKMGIQTFATLGLGRSTSPDTQFRYYLAASPRDAETIVVGFLGGRDRPDIFVQSPADTPTAGAAFDSDAMTFKIRLVVGARVADHRWIQGSLATA